MNFGDITWDAVCRPWILIVAILLSGGVIVWSLVTGIRGRRRRLILGPIRMAALMLILLMLFQPKARREEVTILKPQLAVLVDGSESMTDSVDAGQPLRSKRVAEWFKSKAYADAVRDFDIRVLRFDRNVEDAAWDPSRWEFKGSASPIVKAVNQTMDKFRGQPLAAVLLLSDGIDSSGTDKATPIQTNVPVMTFELEKPFESKKQESKITLAGVDFPPKVIADREFEIRVSLNGNGMAGKIAPVQLWRDGKMLSAVPVTFNEDAQTRSAAFSISLPAAGPALFEVRVDHAAADKEARGYPVQIEAMEPGKRVIYLQNSLGFDLKFLRKAIVSDRNLQLSTFVRLPEGRIAMIDGNGAQAASGYDFSPKSLGNTSVVILGDLSPSALSEENVKALREFVDRGGGLVLLGGTELFTSPDLAKGPLAQLLPVRLPAPYEEGKFAVKMTETGLHHPVFGPLFSKVSDFPPLLSFNDSPGAVPAAEVLMQVVKGSTPRPLVAAMRFGKGKTVVVLSNTLWRWRLAATQSGSGQSPYSAFWSQLMDWLIPKEQEKQNSDSLELFAERSSYVMGEKPEIRAVLRSTAKGALPVTIPLRVKTPDGKNFDYVMKAAQLTMPDGKTVKGYSSEIEPYAPGLFVASSSVTLGNAKLSGELRLVVGKPPTEITGKPVNRELLQRISRESGGRFHPQGEWDGWARDLHVKEQKFSRIELQDLWNSPILLALLILLLCLEWMFRKVFHLP